MAKGADSLRHSKDPLNQIQIVRTLVEQHTSTLTCPGSSPIARLIIGFGSEPVSNRPIDAPDRTEIAGLHQLTELQIKRVRPLIEHRGKDLFRAVMGRN